MNQMPESLLAQPPLACHISSHLSSRMRWPANYQLSAATHVAASRCVPPLQPALPRPAFIQLRFRPCPAAQKLSMYASDLAQLQHVVPAPESSLPDLPQASIPFRVICPIHSPAFTVRPSQSSIHSIEAFIQHSRAQLMHLMS